MEMNTFSFIAELAGSELRGPDGVFSGRFLADSRLVRKGDAFVAFRGENTDGHAFIPDAIAHGASLIICEDDGNIPFSTASLKVSDTYKALPAMAKKRLALHGKKLHIIAITGSVGKTTTRDYLVRCLKTSFRVHSAEHSYNTLIGCSMTILSLPEDAEVLVLEMGTNHPGEIAEMARFFPPTTSVITEVAPAHLEGFGSVEGVLEAKMEIAGSPALKSFFYNGDNPLLAGAASRLPAEIARLSAGMEECDYRILAPIFTIEGGVPELSFSLAIPGDVLHVKARAFGKHAAYPLAFAAGISTRLGVPGEKAVAALREAHSLEGRGRIRILGSGACLIDDSYNANPASMASVLRATAGIEKHRKFAVVGEMLELGERSDDFHRDLLPLLRSFDTVWLVGKTWERIASFTGPDETHLVLWSDSLQKLGDCLGNELGEGDAIVIKGSHGNRLDRLVEILCREASS
ncbi:UDP-N-acetylmuramoyl-tripeptide--D-alanyl-D-alanine ligase [Aminivibrio sp.]|uniref:UDP-N-acetylmuramoyl-tripeptide--D-alanyl-D- alanine ligase n=1 Tax=Aminivibrio sp. TaxID=1872489 RepID=UPI001A499F0F|nr:UDP-N-acetylmuramoyl-tripeptide--D-alanyl-D-alanine ligase [Aminivibrio sp.]MBL3538902.1 UDP-N-acetylmuramoyl-tripeptide--D-alanyl-D-alanine ligase [Aminivibrio sp.]